MSLVQEEVCCDCGLPAVRKQIKKESSPNVGKWFYGCSQPMSQGCKFFQLVGFAGKKPFLKKRKIEEEDQVSVKELKTDMQHLNNIMEQVLQKLLIIEDVLTESE